MLTSSPLDAYTTLFGWFGYNNWFQFLFITGLWLAPFITFVLHHWIEGHKNSSPIKPGVMITLQALEMDVYTAVIVLSLCFVPVIPLSTGDITYKDKNGTVQSADSQDSPYGGQNLRLEGTSTIKIPLWWYLVTRFSTAVNNVGTAMMPKGDDLRAQLHSLGGANIRDQTLRAEVNEFYSQCYLFALYKYQQEKPDRVRQGEPLNFVNVAAQNAVKKWGEDVDWVGSHVLLETPGYYKACPNTQLKLCAGAGYQADPRRPDWPYKWYDAQGNLTTDYGLPTCAEWWTDRTYGLKSKLLKQAAEQGTTTDVLSILSNNNPRLGSNVRTIKAQDALVRSLIENPSSAITGKDMGEAKLGDDSASFNLFSMGWGVVKRAISMIGTAIVAGLMSFTMDAIIQALPMVQAFLLFFMYWSLPFGLIFSGYSWETVVNYSFGFFTVYFWTTLWALADWVHNTLLGSLIDNTQGISSVTNFTSGRYLMVNLVALSLYLALPVFWTYMMNMARVRAAGGLDKAFGEGGGSDAKSAGNKGVGAVNK